MKPALPARGTPSNETIQPQQSNLFASEPARDPALGLGSLVLHLAVELVDLLQGLGLGLLRIRLGVALGFRVLALRVCDL